MSKIKVGIIFGGKSKEHDVSLMSASNVIEAMDKEKYDLTTIGIDKEGNWYIYEGIKEKIKDGSWILDEENLIKDFSVFHDDLIDEIDVFFPVLHGPNGEDGTVQGLLELMGKPYVGCGVLASAVGMDKVMCKKIFKDAGLPQGNFLSVKECFWAKDSDQIIDEIQSEIGYPCFVKPANMGSSVGISKAHDKQELIEGIKEAFQYDKKIIVEANINCREIECAVLGNDDPAASVLGEIVPSKEFYDYQSKYLDDGKSVLIIPADLSEEITEKIRNYAIEAYMAIDGNGLSRVDFFVEKDTDEIFINEINTMPGFTNISMYPKLWEHTGISYHDLIVKLIDLAFEKNL
ncbi:D-alanine--D-alanine ligase [Alkalibacter saccharofermentans]|uniref:D-alanine--D-alanine ligase n=1 Tax=Alkalibacter saccharofermentans DSM 14828 TaxID=1120975 RepID=A0A1M4WZN5_9FIRM|nr:D-alanine--D-alanine ligase [Alkalibacter saccharofermentans]SHE86665.1 D-alanine-D-alanine ligase [Alkalibacter saccharofermentans DSM 14828]